MCVAAVLGGCYSPAYGPCAITCPSGEGCPSGYRCENFVCVGPDETCGGGTGSDGSLVADSSGDATVIDPDLPWTNVGLVPFNPTATVSLRDPSMRDDGAELVVLLGTDLVRSLRPSPTVAWGTLQPITEVNSVDNLSGELSGDGMELVMSKNQSGVDLHHALRTNTSDAFSVFAPMPTASDTGEDYSPSLSRDRLVMVFGSQRGGTTGELYLAKRGQPGDSDWSTIELLPDLNTNSREEGPHLSADQLTIYFVSDRAGGSGGFDIYRSTRTSTTVEFPPATAVTELNTAEDELDPWVSADGRLILFARGGNNQHQLFQATR